MGNILLGEMWQTTRHSGPRWQLLTLLANDAHDNPKHPNYRVTWSSLELLAERARLSYPQALRTLWELEYSGDVEVWESPYAQRGQMYFYLAPPQEAWPENYRAMREGKRARELDRKLRAPLRRADVPEWMEGILRHDGRSLSEARTLAARRAQVKQAALEKSRATLRAQRARRVAVGEGTGHHVG